MATPWDARTYDVSSTPQQAWASDVLARLNGIPPRRDGPRRGLRDWAGDESLLALVSGGSALAIDASEDMVTLARSRLGDRAQMRCQLDLDLAEPVDVIISTAALQWVRDHDRMWGRLAGGLRRRGILEVQSGGEGNIARVREVRARARAPSRSGRPRTPRAPARQPRTERRRLLALAAHPERPKLARPGV